MLFVFGVYIYICFQTIDIFKIEIFIYNNKKKKDVMFGDPARFESLIFIALGKTKTS